MPFCKECGNEIENDVKFCPECGTPVAKTKTITDQKDDVHIHDLINLRKTQRINTREK